MYFRCTWLSGDHKSPRAPPSPTAPPQCGVSRLPALPEGSSLASLPCPFKGRNRWAAFVKVEGVKQHLQHLRTCCLQESNLIFTNRAPVSGCSHQASWTQVRVHSLPWLGHHHHVSPGQRKPEAGSSTALAGLPRPRHTGSRSGGLGRICPAGHRLPGFSTLICVSCVFWLFLCT